jgi:hypothetical protein
MTLTSNHFKKTTHRDGTKAPLSRYAATMIREIFWSSVVVLVLLGLIASVTAAIIL